jgi:HlyD family secretion protein
MKKLFSRRMIIIYIVVAIIGAGGYFYYDSTSGVEVLLYSVDTGPVQALITEDAYIEAIHTAEIQSRVMGTLDMVHVSVGDEVEKGQILFSMNSDVLLLQINQVDSEIDALNAQLLEASKPADQERIKTAALLVSQARDTKNSAKVDYDNDLALYASGALSKQALDQSEILYNNAVKAYNIAVNDSLLVNKGISEHLETQYKASIEALMTQKKILERQLLDYNVYSPIHGTVISLPVKVGHYVMTGTSLLEVADLSEFKLSCDILEEDYSKINLDTQVKLYDKNLKKSYDAEILKIYPKSESQISDLGIKQNRVKIEVLPLETLESYIIGQSLDVDFVSEETSGIRVPVDAVYKSKGLYYVFIVENQMIKQVQIEIGVEGEDYYQVKSGLTSGDEIVEVISNDLEDGMRVK